MDTNFRMGYCKRFLGVKMSNIEYMMCTDMVKWSDDFFRIRHRDLLVKQYDKKTGETRLISPLVHVTNEGKMSGKRGRQSNYMGRRKGFVDFFYPVPRNGFGGLYIEVKAPGEKVTDQNQLNWGEFLNRLNKYVVVDSVREFQQAVEEYMG